jgi:hypothetical protein
MSTHEYLTDTEYRHCAYCGKVTRFRKVYTSSGFGNKWRKRYSKWEIINSPCSCRPPAQPWIKEDYSI